MNSEILQFFDTNPEALPLYECLEKRILAEFDDVKVNVKKTQISFSNRHMFACVSMLPLRRAKERPPVYITVTFGLSRKAEAPRIDAATEPYPNRWTHHLLISEPGQIDEELMEWIREAYTFSNTKTKKTRRT